MEDVFLGLSRTTIEWVPFLGNFILGAYILYREITTYNKTANTEATNLSDRIKELYKEENGELLERIAKQDEEIKMLQNDSIEMKKVHEELYKQVLLYKGIAERRDPDDVAYRKKGEAIFLLVQEAMPMLVDTNKNVNKLALLLEAHFKTAEEVKASV